ncbi:hypothetical protein RD110_15530 [Rhodoferax koreense]|uniref:GH26 domain-containing protein n=1 Tax=Rhodoferax koreensis TaxID=1842727 RepID=A0A1P8JXF7_9BURK|nr:hypothetical protein [Rhodoferax koreense]APW38433.1 hypothetical protein RD110_15530 [Rhodoferax koreense]
MKTLAIHWAGLWAGAPGTYGAYENGILGPTTWEYRRPYYAVRSGSAIFANCNSQDVIDLDLTLMLSSGISPMYLPYVSEPNWLLPGFGTEDPVFAAGMNGSIKGYFNSTLASKPQFCVLMEGYRAWWTPNTNVTGDWLQFMRAWVDKFFSNPNYYKWNGRPVWGMLNCANFAQYTSGNDYAVAKAKIDALRDYSVAQGYGNPYFICLDNNTSSGQYLGCDAYSQYAATYNNASNSQYPYSTLVAPTQAKWTNDKNTNSALTGLPLKVVPHITTGWDFRPRIGSGSNAGGENNPASWIATPTTAEFMAHYGAASAFINAYPTACESGLSICYAWNEFSEGGWLCPTAGDNYGDRIRAIAAFHGLAGPPAARINMSLQALMLSA